MITARRLSPQPITEPETAVVVVEQEPEHPDYPGYADLLKACEAADRLILSCSSLRGNNTHQVIRRALRKAGRDPA